MSITDGLQHYGNIETPDDINYLHGYGLKPINRLELGFIAQGLYFKQLKNYLNPTGNRDFITLKEFITICPKYGFIIRHSSSQTLIYDKNLALLKTIPTPVYSGSSKSGVSENGDILVAYEKEFIIITHGGTIKKTVPHNILTNANSYFSGVHVDSKRDRFFLVSRINNATYYHIGKYSTLEIKHEYQSAINAGFETFLTNGYILSSFRGSNDSAVIVYKINDSTYELSIVLSNNALPFYVVCVDVDGSILGLGHGNQNIYSLNGSDLTYKTLGILPAGYAISDVDKNFYYCSSGGNKYHVVNRRTLETVFTYTHTSADRYGMPHPIQMRGKMPQCRAFHK